MRSRMLATLIIYLSIMFLVMSSDASTVYSKKGFNIGNMTEAAVIVVVGTVDNTEFVYRSNWVPTYTTDVTIDVTDVIKGDIDPDESLVFMVIGGSGINPETGEDLTLEVTATPKFTVGEKVLLFLRRSTRQGRPHNGLQVIAGEYGKRKVVNNKVAMPYSYETTFFDKGRQKDITRKHYRRVELPFDLVVQVAKASIEDPDEIKSIEAEVADAAKRAPQGTWPNIASDLLQRLRTTAARTLEEAKQKQ